MAVTKTHPPETVQAAADLGLTSSARTRCRRRRPRFRSAPGKLRWHFIGHLQSNKARDGVELFEMIQVWTVSRLRRKLTGAGEQTGKRMPILLEVNLANEASKLLRARTPARRTERSQRPAATGNSWFNDRATVEARRRINAPVLPRRNELKRRCRGEAWSAIATTEHGHERRLRGGDRRRRHHHPHRHRAIWRTRQTGKCLAAPWRDRRMPLRLARHQSTAACPFGRRTPVSAKHCLRNQSITGDEQWLRENLKVFLQLDDLADLIACPVTSRGKTAGGR